jgi:hypothetical protein
MLSLRNGPIPTCVEWIAVNPHTCDLRGKRFAIVMAGNPDTRSGEVFKIPDMPANRTDIHNLV